MQNRYVGDVGDFGKYGLLRYLAGQFDELTPLKLGVVWYLYPNESHNNDGAKVQYLESDVNGSFETCDPELYGKLRTLVASDQRDVVEVRRRRILPRSARFFEQELTFAELDGRGGKQDKIERRTAWVAAALRSTADCDVVFVDPDNGVQCKSVQPHSSRGPKYAFRHELLPIIDRGQTLVVYHHISRQKSADAQIREQLNAFQSLRSPLNDLCALRFRRGSSRAFLILPSPRHRALIRQRTEAVLASAWRQHFDLITVGAHS